MKIVFRPTYGVFDQDRFHAAIEKILETRYSQDTSLKHAPQITDCVSALRWILSTSTDFLLPVAYIGDIPRVLYEKGVGIHSLHEAETGDIIFFEKMSYTHKKYMVSHTGIMISSDTFFHSSLLYDGKISRIDDSEYMDSILQDSFLDIAHDPRNEQK